MTEPMSPERMLDRARQAIDPSQADRVRVRAGLERRLDALAIDPGGGAGGGGAGGGGALAGHAGWLSAASLGAGAAALATAAALWWSAPPSVPDGDADREPAPATAFAQPAQTGAVRQPAEAKPRPASPRTAEEAAMAETVTEEAPGGPASDSSPQLAAALTRDEAPRPHATASTDTQGAARSVERKVAGTPARRDGARTRGGTQLDVANAGDESAPANSQDSTTTAAEHAEGLPEGEAPRDYLMAELGLIDGASRALRAGRPTAAMDLLARHRELYGRGKLGTEREALMALALCDLGKTAAARSRAEAFLRRHPGSPLAERVRRAARCE